MKDEEAYLKAYSSPREAATQLEQYFHFYNTERRHQTLGGRQTPDAVYFEGTEKAEAT